MANIKICLDAGHNGKANQSPAVPAYYESDMNWKLHLKLKAELEKYGIQVITTRANQNVSLGTISRGTASKGCDLFLSIHANAVGGGVNETVDYPLVIVQLDGKGDILGTALAKAIQSTMGTTQPADVWKRKNSTGQESYGVLRGAASVGTMGMILEHSFYTQTRAAKWLLDDANLDKLAKAEAEVIAAYYGVKKPVKTMYTLTAVCTLEDKAKADNWCKDLAANGWQVSVAEKTVEAPVEKPPTQAPVAAPVVSLDDIARAVINGDYGNGHATREANLRAAGMLEHYTYAQIRARVNELYK